MRRTLEGTKVTVSSPKRLEHNGVVCLHYFYSLCALSYHNGLATAPGPGSGMPLQYQKWTL